MGCLWGAEQSPDCWDCRRLPSLLISPSLLLRELVLSVAHHRARAL